MFTAEEIEEAYIKLRNYFYYEKYDLSTRQKIFNWSTSNIKNFQEELEKENALENYLSQIQLRFYPKSFESPKKIVSSNYYSNHNLDELPRLSKLMIFIDAPVEIHIISVLWIKVIGRDLDSELRENCYGNRLLSYSGNGKRLFKKYITEYKKWWKGALDKSKSILDKEENATIFTFDIKSYYHSVEFDFNKIKVDGDKQSKKVYIHSRLIDIHKTYKNLISKIGLPELGRKKDTFPLPIGLLSSFVLANDYLRDLDEQIINSNPEFYGRYVDDIILVYSGNKEAKSIDTFINNNLDDILETSFKENGSIKFKLESYKNLSLQNQKVFLYELSHRNSPSILSVLIEEQRQRSSEYRFLSDINDERFSDFTNVIFERSFEFEDGNKAKFKEPNENKFKISSFLAKLTRKIVDYGAQYKEEEVLKVHKFFKGGSYIKHHYFWEKILTLFWVSEKYDYFHEAILEIRKLIQEVSAPNGFQDFTSSLQQHLYEHLIYSAKLAVNLNPTQAPKELVDKNCCTREHLSKFPFLQYTKGFQKFEVNLLSNEALESLKETPELLEINTHLIPTSKSFYWCYLSYFFEQTFKDDFTAFTFSETITHVLGVYNSINYSNINIAEICSIELMDSLSNNKRKVLQVSIPSLSEAKDKYIVSLVNQNVDSKEYKSSLCGKPLLNSDRVKSIDHKLDELSSIPSLDIAVKPELAIPYPSLFHQIAHSSTNEYSLNSGIEFISSKSIGYNFIISTLPIRIDETFKDCIPIIRLKNRYTYKEIQLVKRKGLSVPEVNQKNFFLFHWRGLYFSNYYCFELTSIEDRSIFKSMVDLVIAPVWNMDGHYFKSIANSLVRDIHCYYLQANTSQFHDTRIVQPTKSMHLLKALTKGGTINDLKHNFNLVVSQLEVAKLRQFQSMSYEESQEETFKEINIFKPLPPDWDYDNVKRRINNESMVIPVMKNDPFF